LLRFYLGLRLPHPNFIMGGDCAQHFLFKFVVTNTGNVALTSISLSDSDFDLNGAAAGTAISIPSLAVGGTYETIFTGATWQAGQHTNTATATSTYTDGVGNTKNLSDSDDANYFGANPKIAINKVTVYGSTKGDGLSIVAGSSISWEYTVTNTGNVGISNLSVSDNISGVTPVYQSGDANNNSTLDVGENWLYKATGTAIAGNYNNIGTANGSFNGTPVNATDPSSYTGFPGPGVRTPGFWVNTTWQDFWDGDVSVPSQAGQLYFPKADILLYKNGDPNQQLPNNGLVTDPVTGTSSRGLLIGDYNRDGITNSGENTIFYNLTEARAILGASNQTIQQDSRYILDRALVAAWLNFLAGNPADTVDMNKGVSWLQVLTPDENGDLKGDGYLRGLGSATLDGRSPAIASSSTYWNSGITSLSGAPSPYNLNTGVPLPIDAGNSIKNALDLYNNTGAGIAAAPPV